MVNGMSRLRVRLAAAVGALAAVAGVAFAATTAQADPGWQTPTGRPLRVMAVGDSITQGFDDNRLHVPGVGNVGAWRYWFWHERAEKLGACGPIDMVGEWTTYNNWTAGAGKLPGADTDQHHHAAAGSQINGVVRDRIYYNGAIEKAQPDVMLLLLGTNDLFNFNTPRDTPEKARDDMNALIDLIRSKKPDTALLLMGVNPRGGSKDAAVTKLNGYYQTIAATRDTATSPIEYVDGFTGFDLAADTIDNVHPSLSGQHKISDRFSTALNALCADHGGATTTTTTAPTTTSTAPTTTTTTPTTTTTTGSTTTTTAPATTTTAAPATLEERVATLEATVASLAARLDALED